MIAVYHTFDGDSSAGLLVGDTVGEVWVGGCEGEGRREAGIFPAHVPVVSVTVASAGGSSVWVWVCVCVCVCVCRKASCMNDPQCAESQ